MVERSTRTAPNEVLTLVDLMCELLGACAARFHVADYSLRSLQLVDTGGRVGDAQPIAGTVVGRAFTRGEIQVLSGLLGLIGLAGLKRRDDRVVAVHDANVARR